MPIPDAAVLSIQMKCAKIDDEMCWLIALLSDTGMRLSEVRGLVREDIVLSKALPHVLVRLREWRRLNTASSERIIPLVGSAVWAVNRALAYSSNEFLFPKYCDCESVKANSASSALNKWLRGRVPEGCFVHSFRHSFRDRLRAIECPSEVFDELGGWSTTGVGTNYGRGYTTELKHKYMSQICNVISS